MNISSILEAHCQVCGVMRRFDATLGSLHRCSACGFVAWLAGEAPPFHVMYAESYFSGGEYPDYLGAENELRRSMRRHLEQMERVRPHGGRLFEIGCAYGLFLDEARPKYSFVAGADVSPAPIAWARAQLNVEATAADVTTMSFAEKFDVVCCWDTIEHVLDVEALAASVARMLKPGGIFFATTGDIESTNARRRGARWRQIHPPTHVNYFSPRTLGLLLARYGFTTVTAETAAYYHTAETVTATLALRGGAVGRLAHAYRTVVPRAVSRRIGAWVDLGDTMFLAARLQPAKA